VGVDDVEGVKEELWVALLQKDRDCDTQAVAERQGVGVDEPVMQPVGEEETQVLAEALWLWLPLLDLDPVIVPVALLHGVALAVMHRVALGVSVEPLGLCVGVDDVEGVKEELWVALLQRDGECDAQAVGVGELHGDSEAVRQALAVLEGQGDELLLRHVVWLRLGDTVPVADAQVLELGETEWEAEEEPETELEEVSPSVLVKKRRIQRRILLI
jgi:hypothetical protein